MSHIPDCRTDEYYNQKYLNEQDKEFLAGFDWAVQEILNLFYNVDVYPDLEELLNDKKAVVMDGKIDVAKKAVEHWAEMQRDELIASMLDDYGEEEYEKIKERVDSEDK